jgi:hypothetical protein
MKRYSCLRWPRRMSYRSGTTLIELVSLMMVFGSMMTLTGMAIHRSTQTQKLALSCIKHTKLLDDLHHRMLTDTHAASELTVVNNAIQLLDSSGQTIEYSQDAGSIIRTLKSSSNETIGQARWKIGARQLQVELDTSGAVPLARFSLQLNRLVLDPSLVSNEAKNTAAEGADYSAIETIRWISRLGVEPQ